MSKKIVKTLKFPDNTDEFELNAVRLEGKQASDFASSTRKINNKPLTNDITLTAEDIGAAPISYVDNKKTVTIKTWTVNDIS